MEVWVARDKNGNLNGHWLPPLRNVDGYWRCTLSTHSRYGDWSFPIPESSLKEFEHLTWDDNPIRMVMLTYQKIEKTNEQNY